jgi:NTE family protein
MSPRLAIVLLLALFVSGCSTHRPWINSSPSEPSPPHLVTPGPGRSMVAALTLSGGGTRAAAFGLGVMQALKDTQIEWDGRKTTLLDEVSFISGVSGGSVLAAHYAAFGDESLKTFEQQFLAVNFQARVIANALTPLELRKLTSPWYGRTNVLAEEFDRLFGGRRLGDIANRVGAPELLVTATDLSQGAEFEFSPEQLASMCTDWRQVPISFAVAASAAVPILLTPVTLQNHAGKCRVGETAEPLSSQDFRAQLRVATAASYRDRYARPFVHLVDGGLADNLGVRGLLDRFVAEGSIAKGFRDAPPGSIRRLVLVVVNAEREASEAIELSDRVPSIGQVLDTLVFGAGARDSQVTLAVLRQDVARWRSEIEQTRGRPDSPFAPDAQLHAVVVSLRDVPDQKLRSGLLRLPTSFVLAAAEVSALQMAARDTLLAAEPFRDLLKSLAE